MKLKVKVSIAYNTDFNELLSKYQQFAYAKISEENNVIEYYLSYLGKELTSYLSFLEECAEDYDVEETSSWQDFKDIL